MTIEPRSARFAPPALDDGEPALVALIRGEIEQSGPITFERFMERALYEPGLGYYATSDDRPTRDGDFLTAPELHPIFGWTVAAQIEEMWERLGRPRDFVLREYGAGSGALGRTIAEGLQMTDSRLAGAVRYEALESAGRMVPNAAQESGSMVGCVIANEFLDALPTHRVIATDGGLREVHVDWQEGRFIEVAGPLSDGRIQHELGDAVLAQGRRAEVNLRMADWLTEVSQKLEGGFVLLVDYGLPAADLRSEARASGTIRAFRGQHVSSDVLGGVGHTDITAHIDLDALERHATAAGFEVLGQTTQASFLMGSGFETVYARAREDADRDWSRALELRSAVRRLLDPHHLGAYAVVVLGKGVERDPSLRGLSFSLERPG